MLPAPTLPSTYPARAKFFGRVLPFVVLGLSMLATGIAVFEMRRAENIEARTEFDHLSQRLARDLESRLASYLQLAQGAAGLLSAGVKAGPVEWAAYTANLPITKNSAGYQGMGVALRQAARSQGMDERFPLAVLLPLGEASQGALGMDMAADPAWRTAIELARDRGEASFSEGSGALAGLGDARSGLLALAPFYRGGKGDIHWRRQNLAGVVFVSLNAERVLQSVLGTDGDALAMRLSQADNGRLLADTAPDGAQEVSLFRTTRLVSAGGKVWRLEFASTQSFTAHIDRRHSLLIGLVGVIAALLLSGATLYLAGLRKKADQKALERYREFLLRILDALPEPIVVKTADRRIVIANQSYADWVGMSPADLVGRTTHEFFPGDVADECVDLDQQVLATGKGQEIEMVVPDRRRQGELRHVITRKMPCRGIKDEPLVVGIHHDVTEARQSEDRFRQLTEMSSDWYWEQDENLRFTMLSGKGSKGNMFADEVVGKYRWDFPIGWSEAEWAEHKALLAAHKPFHDLEYQLRLPGVEPQWYSISGEPIFDTHGRFTGYRGIGRNITVRRTVEDELRQHRDHLAELVEERTAELLAAKNAAEQASHVKSEFLANMSHELRTPLHAILSFARLGHERSAAPEMETPRRYFTRIVDAGDRLLALINDLLDLSKFEAGKMSIHRLPGDLASLLRDVATEFDALAEERGLRLDMPPPERTAMAVFDAPRIAQVLRNVLSNAIKFSPVGGCVHIGLDETEMLLGRRTSDLANPVAAWRICITDEGVGIPADELDLIFDKFTQSSNTRARTGGTGLGLSICQEIMTAHRGQIVARNCPAGGAVFEILIPR